MDIIDKAKNGIKTGVKYIGKGAQFVGKAVSDAFTTIMDDISEARAEKTLNEKLLQKFNLSAQRLAMVTTGDNPQLTTVYAQVDVKAKTLTLFGEIENLSSKIFFIDEEYRKLEIVLIRLRQTTDIILDNVIYPSPVTVVEYRQYDDEETKKRMSIIVNNGEVPPIDEIISKN